MVDLGYEIKYGKHIAFKAKDKMRFTRAKTLGEDYTEYRIKERIAENSHKEEHSIKKCVGNIIYIGSNEKIKSSKGYEYWTTKHNLQVASDTVILMRGQGFKSFAQLDEYIKQSADKRQNLQDEIKRIEQKITNLSSTMEQIHIIKKGSIINMGEIKYKKVYQKYSAK